MKGLIGCLGCGPQIATTSFDISNRRGFRNGCTLHAIVTCHCRCIHYLRLTTEIFPFRRKFGKTLLTLPLHVELTDEKSIASRTQLRRSWAHEPFVLRNRQV